MSFDQGPVSGTTLTAGSIHSPNYATGSSGWTINKDGSAEFQNVLVRGTITASNIIGSTITGGTIVGGDIQSANFSNTADTGFDFNGTASTDSAGTPANTMQIYTGFIVGPSTGNNIQLTYSSSQAAVDFFTGNAADTVSAAITATTFTQSGSGRTISNINILSATEANGHAALTLQPSGGTTAADFPAEVLASTIGETAPSGWNGVTGRLYLGANGTTDIWQQVVTNENSVISSGNTLGNPPLVLGDLYTPRSRLFVSVSELLTVNGSGNVATLYLNENNAEAVAGSLANKAMRAQYSRDTTSRAGLTSTATSPFVALGSALVTVTMPASGVLQIWYKATISATPAVIADQFFLDVLVKDTTASTTVYGGSTLNASYYTNPTAVSADNSPFTVSGFVLIGSATGQGSSIVPGNTITVGPAYAVSAGSWTVSQSQVMVTPSL
jgi:hypothetical protein